MNQEEKRIEDDWNASMPDDLKIMLGLKVNKKIHKRKNKKKEELKTKQNEQYQKLMRKKEK